MKSTDNRLVALLLPVWKLFSFYLEVSYNNEECQTLFNVIRLFCLQSLILLCCDLSTLVTIYTRLLSVFCFACADAYCGHLIRGHELGISPDVGIGAVLRAGREGSTEELVNIVSAVRS